MEGSGGTSAIQGTVNGTILQGNNSSSEQEVTDITIPHGSDINDGEYILLNTPNGGNLYYLWFKWNSGVQPDPNLAGRTAIQVDYDFTESNTVVAANVKTAIESIASADFSVSVNNDIVSITNTAFGNVTDAEELSSNIVLDISNQGQNPTQNATSITGPIADERVFLIYGDDEHYSESVRTDANGFFQFKNLNRGNYTIYAFSLDTISNNGQLVQIQQRVEITNKKEVVEAPALNIVVD